MKNQEQFSHLLAPGKIGTMELKNRIVMPPMLTSLCSATGEVTPAIIDWYVRRAQSGIGLVIIEDTYATPEVDPFKNISRSLRIDDDCYAPGLAELAEAVHDVGNKVALEITAGTGAQALGTTWLLGRYHSGEVTRVSSSNVTSPWIPEGPRPLTVEEIRKVVKLVGSAAGRAKRAGFDAVEIHAHRGFLIGQFMSPYYNKRTDQYGGNLDGRLRMLLEIVDCVRENVGPGFPLIVKYSVKEYAEGGIDVDEGQEIAKRLQRAGVDAIEVSCGLHGTTMTAIAPYLIPEGYMLPLAEALKEVVTIPIIVAGRLENPVLAEQVLKENRADFIAWGRGLIADPDLPKKVMYNRTDEIRGCIFCDECLRFIQAKMPIRCTVNPVAGRESRYGAIKPTERTKRIMVIGAGPAGMEAARVAALRGHTVELFEKNTELGSGQLKLATVPPHKEVLKDITSYYSVAFRQLHNLKIVLGKEVTAMDVAKEKPDVVIVATGGLPLIPDIPGTERNNVVTAHDLLAGKAEIGEKVIVIGGSSVGLETANFLAKQGKRVSIVEMSDEVATDVHRLVRMALMEELSQSDVTIITQRKVQAITDQGIIMIDKAWRQSTITADAVVLATGAKSVNELAKELAGKVEEIYTIGDAKEPRRIRNAISDGYVTSYGL